MEHARFTQCTINFICGYLKVPDSRPKFSGIFVLRINFPVALGRIQQRLRTYNIGRQENFRLHDTPIHMRLCREVNDCIKVIFCKQLLYQFLIPDIALYKLIVGVVFHRFQIFQISSIGQ